MGKKHETIVKVEAVIVFFLTRRKWGEKKWAQANLQKLLLSVTIKHNSDTNNLISSFLRIPPAALAMKNHFTIKVPFCYIEHDLANATNKQEHVLENSDITAAGRNWLQIDLPGWSAAGMDAASGHLVIIVIQLLSLAEVIWITSPPCISDSPNEEVFNIFP